VLRDRDHSEVWYLSSRRLGRQAQIGLNHVLQLIGWLLHGLVNDDPDHSAAVVEVHLLQNTGGIYAAVFVVLPALHLFLKKTS